MSDGPRRSAGMRGHPLNSAPEHRPVSATPKAKLESPSPERVSRSPYARPKVLMGEVVAPKGPVRAPGRDGFRAFMLRHCLQPTGWARTAGVSPGEVLAYLTGQALSITPESLEKLAAAANTSPAELFK